VISAKCLQAEKVVNLLTAYEKNMILRKFLKFLIAKDAFSCSIMVSTVLFCISKTTTAIQ